MKDELRLRFRALRDALGRERRAVGSQSIAEHVQAMRQFVDARHVLLYASFGSEVDTAGLRHAAQADRKTVYLPRMDGRRMHACVWTTDEALVPNRFGIPEPPAAASPADVSQIDLVLVPGLAFDERGARLGYGGGYYDRLLGTIPRAYRVGVGFAIQVVGQLPTTHLDVPMDCIVTENGVRLLPRRHH